MTTFSRTLKVRVKNKKLSTSSKKWIERQLNDPFVHKAKAEGYRSRAAFKLLEMHEKFNLIKKGMTIVDLGAAPGGWSQVASTILKGNGHIYAIDLLPMEPLSGVHCVQGDFNDFYNISHDLCMNELIHTDASDSNEVAQHDLLLSIRQAIHNGVDLVLSDMAPSACGIKSVDHDRIMGLLEDVFIFACEHLRPNGTLVAKVLRGGTEGQLLGRMKKMFKKVSHFKPTSSRAESCEIFVVAQDFRGTSQEN